MRRIVLAAALAALVVAQSPAAAQTFSARRMAMGGVMLAGGGPGSDAANVAYRVVPAAPGVSSGITLPLGLIPFLADLPSFDPKSSDFNAYELADLLYNPPWNLQLYSPKPPSNDITISVAKNSLAVDLGDVADIFPKDHSKTGAVNQGPGFAVGLKSLFVGVMPLVHYENDLSLNDALRGAVHGDAFTPNTDYALFDKAKGQVAGALQFGWAMPLMVHGDPRAAGGSGVYAGARVKFLRGIAYGDADNTVAFTTGDTLFGTDPVQVHYDGIMRDAGPENGRYGHGLDLGIALLSSGRELGVGVNDVATTIDWRVREIHAYDDSLTGDYVQDVLRRDAPFTSHVPATVHANVGLPLGRLFVAADVVRSVHTTLGHVGVETWSGPLALRAGGSVDANHKIQYSAGTGYKFGHLGVDVALATNSRNLSRERGLELGAGIAFYH
jgi:hypothetical protein